MVLLIFKLSRHAEGAGPNEVQSEEGGRRRAVLKNRTEEVSASSVLRVKAIEKLVSRLDRNVPFLGIDVIRGNAPWSEAL